jgi:hypothetical protein
VIGVRNTYPHMQRRLHLHNIQNNQPIKDNNVNKYFLTDEDGKGHTIDELSHAPSIPIGRSQWYNVTKGVIPF